MGKFEYALLMFMSIVVVVNSSAAVEFKKDIGGWTFSANLDDGFRLTDNPVKPYADLYGDDSGWKGFMIDKPAYYPGYPNAPKGNKDYETSTGAIDEILVVKIRQDRIDEKLQHNMALYGSADKIPVDRKEQDMKDLLSGAAFNLGEGVADSEKDIDFSGRMAHLSERDSNSEGNRGTIVVLLDNVTNTIGVINVNLDTEHTPNFAEDYQRPLTDGKYYDKRPWDIINSFKIEKNE